MLGIPSLGWPVYNSTEQGNSILPINSGLHLNFIYFLGHISSVTSSYSDLCCFLPDVIRESDRQPIWKLVMFPAYSHRFYGEDRIKTFFFFFFLIRWRMASTVKFWAYLEYRHISSLLHCGIYIHGIAWLMRSIARKRAKVFLRLYGERGEVVLQIQGRNFLKRQSKNTKAVFW